MPLHDWAQLADWETVHTYWIGELGHWLKPRLPPGYRVSLGTLPALVVAPGPVHPDLNVQRSAEQELAQPASIDLAPDDEVAVATLDPARALYVTRGSNLVAVIELISPRNKDRLESRQRTIERLLGYLTHGIHLLFVDVHPQPLGFSFADALAMALPLPSVSCPAPCAVSYRFGNPAPETGHYLAVWRRPLTIGAVLPCLPLPLRTDAAVVVDLESTYRAATAAAYIE